MQKRWIVQRGAIRFVRGRNTCPVRRGWENRAWSAWRRGSFIGDLTAASDMYEKTKPGASLWYMTRGVSGNRKVSNYVRSVAMMRTVKIGRLFGFPPLPDLISGLALRKQLAKRLPEIPFDLTYPMILSENCLHFTKESLKYSTICPGNAAFVYCILFFLVCYRDLLVIQR